MDDAQVIQRALKAHAELMRAAEHAHRAAAAALPKHPQLVRTQEQAIALTGAHRARSAGYAQRADFVDQLVRFPAVGLRALTEHDMTTLRVPPHIGTAATAEPAPPPAPPSSHPTAPPAEQEDHDDGAADSAAAPGEAAAASTPPQPHDGDRMSFEDILYGRTHPAQHA